MERLSKNGKKIGRPRKYGVDVQSPCITFRLPRPLYDALVGEAETTGRGLAGAIVYRLQASFDREAILADMRLVLNENAKAA